MRLYLFDFDGTISKSDSMFDFLKTIHGLPYFYFLLFKAVPIFVCYKLKIINKDKFKDSFLMIFLSKFSFSKLEIISNDFSFLYEKKLKSSAIKYINNLKKDKNNEIIIVTASLDIWIKPIAEKLGIKFISTKASFNNNLYNGIKGKNCWGKEKVNRIKLAYNLKKYNEIHAFGDSEGDFEMLNIANYKNFRFFN